ncbi:hypothetical protein PS15p_200172 [Mucor circinelloides]
MQSGAPHHDLYLDSGHTRPWIVDGSEISERRICWRLHSRQQPGRKMDHLLETRHSNEDIGCGECALAGAISGKAANVKF